MFFKTAKPDPLNLYEITSSMAGGRAGCEIKKIQTVLK